MDLKREFDDRLKKIFPEHISDPRIQELSSAYFSGQNESLTTRQFRYLQNIFLTACNFLNDEILQTMSQFQPLPDRTNYIDKTKALEELKTILELNLDFDDRIKKALIAYQAKRWNLDPVEMKEIIGKLNEYKAFVEDYEKNWVNMEDAQLACYVYDRVPNKTQPMVDVPTKVSSRGFRRAYANNKASIDHYVKFVRSTILEFRENAELFYALYATLIQSSGYGKSRLILEAGKKHLNTVYGNLNSFDVGYPRTNKSLREFFSKNNDETVLEYFLASCYYVAYHKIIEYNGNDHEIHPLSLLEGNDYSFKTYWDEVIALTNVDERREEVIGFFTQQQKDVEDYYKQVEKDGLAVNGRIKSNGKYILPELVVVLDEAKYLLENDENGVFRKLRRALQSIESTNMLILLTDTLSTLSDFAPARPMHSSYRPDQANLFLLQPFYEILTYDVLAEVPHAPVSTDYGYLRQIFYQGRPLWRALYENETNDKLAVEKMIEFARAKLVFSKSGLLPHLTQKVADSLSHLVPEDRSKFVLVENSAAIIAVFALRFGIQGIMDHTVASTLMSSYMGTGMFIGDDRLRIVVQYPPEPLLAEAACQCLHTEETFDYAMISRYTQVFLAKCVKGFVHAGDIGELLARMILSLTYDSVKLSHTRSGRDKIFSSPVIFSEFMSELISEDYAKEFEKVFNDTPLELIPEPLKNGEICITSWTALSSFKPNVAFIDDSWLNELFEKRTGIIFGFNQKGVDLLIPIRIMGEDGQFIYSMALVQVKNRDDVEERFKYAGPCLEPFHCFRYRSDIPYISLYIEVGAGMPLKDLDQTEAAKHSAKHPHHIMLLGFESFKICSLEPLKSLFNLSCHRQIQYLNEEDRADVLYNMNPVTYKFLQKSCGCLKEEDCCAKPPCSCFINDRECNENCSCILQGICRNNHIMDIDY